VVIALGVWGWVVGLPFQLDDHSFLRFAAFSDESGAIPNILAPGGEYLFRPVQLLWLSFWSLLDGVPLHPAWYHAASLLLHGVAVWLIHSLLLRWTSRHVAWLGASVFALMPAGGEAIAWIAASGDLMITVLGLGAVNVLLRQRGSWSACVIAGCFAGVGLLAKETMLSLLPTLAAMVALVGSRDSVVQRLRGLACFSAPILVAWLTRAWFMDTFSFKYAGGRSLSLDWPQLQSFLLKVPDLISVLLAPFTPSFEAECASALPWPRMLSIVLVGIPALIGVFFHAHGRRVFLAFAVLLPAPLFAAPPQAGEMFLRSLYLPGAVFALLWAFGAESLLKRGRSAWPLFGVLTLGAVVVHGEGIIRMCSLWNSAGAEIRTQLEAIETACQEDNQGVVVVLSSPTGKGGVPKLGNLVQHAFHPPFRAESAEVIAWDNQRALLNEEALLRASAHVPVRILDFDPRGTVQRARQLPAGTNEAVASGPDADGWWRWDEHLAPRAAPEISLRIPAGPELSVTVELATAEGSEPHKLHLPASASPRTAQVLFDQDAAWMFASTAPRIRISGAPLLAAPRAGLVARSLTITSPEEGAVLRTGILELRSTGWPDSAAIMAMTCHVRVAEGQWMPAFFMRTAAPPPVSGMAERIWSPQDGDEVTEAMCPGLRPESLAAIAARHLLPLGLKEVVLRVRVDAQAADGTVLARSGWRQVRMGY
jgi:hypothetical protein